MGTIKEFLWESIESGRRITIPLGNIIPHILPSPFVDKFATDFKRTTNFKEIGTDPFPGKRKRLVIKYDDNDEDLFPESTEVHRNINIKFRRRAK